MSTRVWIWLLLLSGLWGGSFFFARVALAELGPSQARPRSGDRALLTTTGLQKKSFSAWRCAYNPATNSP